MSILRNSTLRGDGQRTVSQLLRVFQGPLAAELLALAIANMLLLWNLDPPFPVGESQSTTSNLFGLGELLSGRKALSHSYILLLDLFASFCNAVKVLDAERSMAITQFLLGAVCFIERACPNEELSDYFVERLTRMSTDEAARLKASDCEILIEGFVLL